MRILISALLLAGAALAQDAADPNGRIIRIELQEATVSNLTILSGHAMLAVPQDQQDELLLADAEGSREATFDGGVRVLRGRLEADGPGLVYSEATGLGVLQGPAVINIAPADEDDDPVRIDAGQVEFDVDSDMSSSSGDVVLVSGNQTATASQLVYAEERDLGVLTAGDGQVRIVRTDEDGGELVITADEVRVLTDDGKLYASGNVTVLDGDITSTGSEVFFDDEASRAEVLGSPARSVDEAAGVELSGDRLEHRTDLGVVSIIDASQPSEFDVSAFSLQEGELD